MGAKKYFSLVSLIIFLGFAAFIGIGCDGGGDSGYYESFSNADELGGTYTYDQYTGILTLNSTLVVNAIASTFTEDCDSETVTQQFNIDFDEKNVLTLAEDDDPDHEMAWERDTASIVFQEVDNLTGAWYFIDVNESGNAYLMNFYLDGSFTVTGDLARCDSNRFTDMLNGTIRDNLSGLIWLKNANAFGVMDWDAATAAVAALNSGELGLTDGSAEGDWRLPTRAEWAAFFVDDTENNDGYENPALVNTVGDGQWTEGDAFNGVQSANYWSSSLNPDDSTEATYAGMNVGATDAYASTTSVYNVWPVRDDD